MSTEFALGMALVFGACLMGFGLGRLGVLRAPSWIVATVCVGMATWGSAIHWIASR